MCLLEINGLITTLVDYIGKIFTVIGILLLAYSVGQLVLAFKNEDADSKARATQTLVVSAVLIGLPAMINGLNLTGMIPSFGE